jgi:hypothetical protein
MPRQPVRPLLDVPLRQTLCLAACVLALSFAVAAGARAQDDDDDGDDDAAPLVIDIEGPCLLTIKGQSIPCLGVAYMVFPSSHRIDFTAITDTAGWAFSGEDDENRGGRYALDLDSVLNLGSGRVAADGRCEMQVGEDRRTVRSLDCRAGAGDGEFTLKASGTITLEDAGNDDDGGPDDGDDDDSVVS